MCKQYEVNGISKDVYQAAWQQSMAVYNIWGSVVSLTPTSLHSSLQPTSDLEDCSSEDLAHSTQAGNVAGYTTHISTNVSVYSQLHQHSD